MTVRDISPKPGNSIQRVTRDKKRKEKKIGGGVCHACYTSTDIVAKWPYGYRNNGVAGGWDDCGGRRDALCT